MLLNKQTYINELLLNIFKVYFEVWTLILKVENVKQVHLQ